MILKVKKLHSDAVLPRYQSDGAACFDLVAVDCIDYGDGTALYSTGLAFDIPQGYVLLVYSRSGHGFSKNTRLTNCVGVIDSDYRGEVFVKLIRDDDFYTMPKIGDRVAQAMLMPVNQVEIQECEEMSETKRGVNGFGSTGK
jgi:dUTP pyrophosphatase